jgi:hypothetical protein
VVQGFIRRYPAIDMHTYTRPLQMRTNPAAALTASHDAVKVFDARKSDAKKNGGQVSWPPSCALRVCLLKRPSGRAAS